MVNAGQLILDFEKSGHPLGKGIQEEETSELVNKLRQRLKVSENTLDLSPHSLDILSDTLFEYYRNSLSSGISFTDEEVVKIIREIAAYFGEVVLRNTKGKWRVLTGIWGTEILFEGPTKAIKGKETLTSNFSVISLGQIASGTWTALQKGIVPKLKKVYQLSISKNVKENL